LARHTHQEQKVGVAVVAVNFSGFSNQTGKTFFCITVADRELGEFPIFLHSFLFLIEISFKFESTG